MSNDALKDDGQFAEPGETIESAMTEDGVDTADGSQEALNEGTTPAGIEPEATEGDAGAVGSEVPASLSDEAGAIVTEGEAEAEEESATAGDQADLVEEETGESATEAGSEEGEEGPAGEGAEPGAEVELEGIAVAGIPGGEGEGAEAGEGEEAEPGEGEEAGLAGEEESLLEAEGLLEEEEREKKKRRRLVVLLLVLVLLLCCVAVMFYRYLNQPAPLPELLPVPVDLDYAPHYLFSIYGVDNPVGVTLSPVGDRIYAAETGGERLVKVFDREGNPAGSFAPPRTRSGERSPVYLATDSRGRVFVTDRLQHAVFIYDREGNYLDTILAPDLTLSEYLFKHLDDLHDETAFFYNVFWGDVYYQEPGEIEQTLPAPDRYTWAPLGIRIDETGEMLLTDVDADRNTVRFIPAALVLADSWHDFEPAQEMLGETGQENGQLLFPNGAVRDSQGRIYVSDGNNGRISVWDSQDNFLFAFGQGTGDGSLNLPRGETIGPRDRLHVVDAVGQDVKVYDVSGPEPVFLFAFGDWGAGDGQFNYPNDIAMDTSGRLYIADRENNRIQVWSY